VAIENYYVECDCHADEHTLRFMVDSADGEVTVSTFLNHYRPWCQRLRVAVKYLMGYKCKYGHFDTTIISGERLNDLQAVIDAARASQPR
jgi:hypothetical protein